MNRGFLPIIWMVLGGVLIAGCAREQPLADQDLADARATVERALRSETFEEFLSCMSDRNRQYMRASDEYRRFWSDQKKDGKPIWRIGSVTDAGSGKAKVETTRIPDSPQWSADSSQEGSSLPLSVQKRETLRVYFLIKENGSWVMDEIAFGL